MHRRGYFWSPAFKLAADGFRVLIHGRSREKVTAGVCSVEESGGLADGFVADLSSLKDVHQLATTVMRRYPMLHRLLNNAGTFVDDYSGCRRLSVDGNESSLAVSILVPFLLTSLLLPNLAHLHAGRVVITFVDLDRIGLGAARPAAGAWLDGT